MIKILIKRTTNQTKNMFGDLTILNSVCKSVRLFLQTLVIIRIMFIDIAIQFMFVCVYKNNCISLN